MDAFLPRYWKHETSGVLRPAVHAYLTRAPMTDEQIAAMRAYLRQWIEAPCWVGNEVCCLRAKIEALTSLETIEAWIAAAEAAGIDPL